MKKIVLIAIATMGIQFSFAQKSPHGELEIDCDVCHTPDSWQMRKDSKFDHKSTGFILAGAHRLTPCKSCHTALVFRGAKQDCKSCHTDVHKADLGAQCVRCHSSQSWRITDMIQRHAQTRFPLIGRHATAQCEACHARIAEHQYSGIPVTCIGCHNTDFQSAQNPNHSSAGFSTDCAQCHSLTAATWGGPGFNHQLKGFPLLGAHRAVPCLQCHVNNRFAGLRSGCIDCHQADFSGTTNPNHVSASFSANCLLCHSMNGWTPATFNHATTKFPLTGAHAAVLCSVCHVNGNYQLVYSTCFQCHQTDFQNATNPNHIAGNFGQTCDQCHSTTTWSPASFNHAATKFPLTGAHVAVSCQTCHTNGNYQLVYSSCYQCHQTDFQNATNPNHVAGNFTHTCEQCHSTTAWSPATFNHATTKFPLTGAHASVACQSCHTNGNYQLVYTNCYQCHSTDFAGATSPVPHTGFSTDCTTCHTTSAWSPSTFTHANVTPRFPLDGRHTGAACAKCHQTATNYTIICCQSSGCHNTCAGGDD